MKQFSISLGKAFGIPISIHWTFWMLVIWIVFTGVVEGQSVADLLWHVVFVFTVFACVGLHELGHALMAKRYGIQTDSIVFLPIGGVASLSRIPKEPKKELIITLAGPMVNVIIALVIYLILMVTGKLGNIIGQIENITAITSNNLLFMLFMANVMLFLFNLIPALPMDGGRIFRSLLAMKISRVKATKLAVKVGQVFAILFVLLGLFSNPFLIVIAVFILLGAQSELEQVKTSETLSHYASSDLMMQNYTVFNEDQILDVAAKEIIKGQESVFLVRDKIGIVGYFVKNDLIKGLSQIGKNAKLKYILNINLKWVSPDLNATHVYDLMIQEKLPIILVGGNGILEGVINMENLQELVLIDRSQAKFQDKEETSLSKEWAFHP